MIDNPLPNEIMSQNDEYYFSEQFYEHCRDKAVEIAVKSNLLPELIDDFIEYYIDICCESDEGFSLINDKSLIDEWWEENSDMYENPSPYKDYEPTDLEMMSMFGTKWHDGL